MDGSLIRLKTELSEKEVVIRKMSKVKCALPKEARLEISQKADKTVDDNLAVYSKRI